MATTTKPDLNSLDQFHWEPQPKAQRLINDLITDFMAKCPDAAELGRRMKSETATRFHDWLDSIHVKSTPDLRKRLAETGFSPTPQPGASDCFEHLGAMFPRVVLTGDTTMRFTIKVDSVMDFVSTWQLPVEDHPIEGDPWTPYRRAIVFRSRGAELWVAERHGYRGFEPGTGDAVKGMQAVRHAEAFRRRQRDFDTDEQGFAHLHKLIDSAVADLGKDWACSLFFYGERDHWQRRNRAGQVQFNRQNALGLGWANHDHHTYRSSRQGYVPLIAALEKLGFVCREKFYAGHQAGWGAQVLEQPVAGITIFADVDMSPAELVKDFPHKGFPTVKRELGTIGLWCGLHGEAILQAGMHHLECQFDWHELVKQLQHDAHIRTMPPFTTFPFLRQAFTEGEHWPVAEKRVQRLLDNKQITPEQAAQFRTYGALGSHLENLERNDGFKGFNQEGVSDIIARTDPRKQQTAHAAS